MKPEWCPQDVWEVADDLVENYGFHDVREQTNVTDVWAVEDDLHRQAIARALLEAEQRGRRQGMEEAAEMSDAWKRPSAVKLAAGEMTAQELRTAIAVAGGISSAIRAKMEEFRRAESFNSTRS